MYYCNSYSATVENLQIPVVFIQKKPTFPQIGGGAAAYVKRKQCSLFFTTAAQIRTGLVLSALSPNGLFKNVLRCSDNSYMPYLCALSPKYATGMSFRQWWNIKCIQYAKGCKITQHLIYNISAKKSLILVSAKYTGASQKI